MKYAVLILLLFVFSCKTAKQSGINPWMGYDEKNELAMSAKNESVRLRYKLIQSKILDKNDVWKNVFPQIKNFSESDYLSLEPLIFNQDIPTLQSNIKAGKLTYEKLTQWYLYRIVKFENDKNKALNNIISINPNAVKEARKKDRNKSDNNHPTYGMPVLLKDNIDFEGLATTAGAHALQFNYAKNAFIVDRLKENGAIILGKVNLSEWANYLCLECPNGYSAIGGQTLNPYGIKKIDTGGSSAGSGSSMAANYAAAAVGTETSGSILSPSSQHSLVGLKPTTGLLSRSGIVPISSTFDTPGPMTRNVIDNAIMLDAMSGTDKNDAASKNNPKNKKYWQDVKTGTLAGVKFGVIKAFLKDTLYQINIDKIKLAGGIMIDIEFEQNNNDGFGTLLNTDMKVDLANYLKNDFIPLRGRYHFF
jgi:amidase